MKLEDSCLYRDGDNNEQIGSLYIGDEYLKQSIWQKQVEFLMAAGVEPATIT